MAGKLDARLSRLEAVDLYPVITPSLCAGRDPVFIAQALLEAGCRILQLRAKSELTDAEHYAMAVEIRLLSRRHEALLIIDDRIDIALAAGADGVHLGLDDIPLEAARRIAPELLLGASSHSLEEALEHQAQGASYVNIGPLFPTATKTLSMAPLGPEAVANIGPRLRVPFTVMGGIKLHHISELVALGARRIAMVTALTQAQDVAEAARAFRRAMGRLGCEPALTKSQRR